MPRRHAYEVVVCMVVIAGCMFWLGLILGGGW